MIQTQGNSKKPHFVSDLGQLSPNSAHKFFLLILVVRNCLSYNKYVVHCKTNKPNLRK